MCNRHFKPLLESAGLPSIRLDDLHNTCFMILLARGTHVKYVQDLAGHASIHRALDRYSNWIDSMGSHAADGMDGALSESLLLPYCCQDPSNMIVGYSLFVGFAGKIESRRADSNR